MPIDPKLWRDRPFGPNPGESLRDFEARLADYEAAHPGSITPLNALGLTDLEVRLSNYADGLQAFARKSADEQVTNSAVLQDDDDLWVPVEEAALYVVDGLLAYNSPSAADLQVTWSMPAGSTFRGALFGVAPNATGSSFAGNFFSPPLVPSSFPADAVQIGGTGGELIAILKGFLNVGATPGEFRLRWAQLTANASPTTVREGSFMQLRRAS
jgi:hypothetical protein